MERSSSTRTRQGDPARDRQTASSPSRSSRVRAHPLREFQLALGNRAAGHFVQASLKVSQPGDTHEQEADRVAEEVMRLPEPGIQRACSGCSNGSGLCHECATEQETVQRKAAGPTLTPLIQRDLDVCEIPEAPVTSEDEEASVTPAEQEEEPLQRSADGHAQASSAVAESLQESRGHGGALPDKTRQELGSKMGADFSGVRIHTDGQAVRLSRALGAHALTHGADIYFDAGKYNPDSADGKYLLAHELAHTMQQDDGIVQRLTVTPQTPLSKGPCGRFAIRWIFALDAKAPADGYIVQQIDGYRDITKCPSIGRCIAKPTETFWEAWFVKKDDTHEHLHASMGFTDESKDPGTADVAGFNVRAGEIKFFPQSVTGDLGKDGVAPASPNGGWGPGNAPKSASLPSTTTKPTWWGNAPTEGPATRMAYAAWRCCSTGTNYNVIKATP